MTVNFIRHGKTEGNMHKRYIGSTDEPLCKEGIAELGSIKYPDCDILVSSPMLRCRQTTEIIYPDKDYSVYENLRECDFGMFEGKNYMELSDLPEYQKWIDGNAEDPFPEGEDPYDFRRRCVSEFEKIISSVPENSSVSFVVHGGVIMSVLEKYAYPQKAFYEWSTENGHGYITEFDGERITVSEKI